MLSAAKVIGKLRLGITAAVALAPLAPVAAGAQADRAPVVASGTPAVGAAVRWQSSDTISRALAIATFDTAWSRVRTLHYDSLLNGVDWRAVREELRPRAERARSLVDLRSVLNEMLSRLGESHFSLIPREASLGFVTDSGAGREGVPGDVGMEMRFIGDAVYVTRVDSAGPAFRAGVRAGWRVESVGQLDVAEGLDAARKAASERAAREMRMRLVLRLHSALRGEVGSSAAVRLIDERGASRELALKRRAPFGEPVKYGSLPTTVARVDTARIHGEHGCVGVIGFNTWMIPVARLIDDAVDSFRSCDAMILDLRGNTGGIANMVIGVSGHFMVRPETLGVMRTRSAVARFIANPRVSNAKGELVQPFSGKLALLVDNLTASTSEIFAAAMQSLGRARLFGDTTAGQALPATLHRLPSDDVLMLAVADFRGAKGERIEGSGIAPDVVRVPEIFDLAAGRDPVLDAALQWLSNDEQSRSLPPAEEVIARYVRATRTDLIVSHGSMRLRFNVEIPASGGAGTIDVIRARPNLTVQTTRVTGRGESVRGFDGRNAWTTDPVQGPRLLSGSDLVESREESVFGATMRDSTLLKVRETMELTELGGEMCYRLRLVTRGDRESFECYSVRTGLLVASQRKVNSRMGMVDELSTYSDYREFGGALFATRRVVEALGQRLITTLENVEFDTVDPREFEPPPAVKALIGGGS